MAMGKWYKRLLICAMIAVPALAAIFFGARSDRNVEYDIAGTYRGTFMEHPVYYVFEPSGQYCIYTSGVPSVVHDEGTYEGRGDNIFALESTMDRQHTVVCGGNIIYDFDLLNQTVSPADKITREIFYVNLTRDPADRGETGQ